MKFSCSNMNFFLDLLSKESCSCPNIKKILMFPKTGPYTFNPKPKKTEKKKKNTQKNPLYFWKWNFLVQILKKFLYFLIFSEIELSSSSIKKIPHIFSKEGISYISENGTLHFSVEAQKIKEIHSGKWKPQKIA